MLKELIKEVEAKKFFSLVKNKQTLKYNLHHCGLCMKQNIINEWMRFILSKSGKKFKVLVQDENSPAKTIKIDSLKALRENEPMALIEIARKKYTFKRKDELSENFRPSEATELKLSVAVQQTEAMEFFLQWQRYRKIWWSSISTSPGLFALKDIIYKKKSAEVDVVAKFPWGHQSVENISINGKSPLDETPKDENEEAVFACSFTVECALLTLLGDGYLNRTSEGYIRLHRTIAPYKLSFAISCEDEEVRKKLKELASFINYRLNKSGISTWFPGDFHTDVEKQFVESYTLGIPYTVVLTPDTLETGIFHLLNSSTTLKEQIHISDFDDYALMLFKSVFIT